MSVIYQDVFGGANIYPSEIDYSSVALTADVTLSWPEETSTNQNLATKIMDVTPDSAGHSVILPSAAKTGTGQTILFNNRGAFPFIVKNAAGVQVVELGASELWQVYLTDNGTAAGVWIALQYGATTSIANASALAGTGLVAVGAQLRSAMPMLEFNSNYTFGANDRAYTYNWTGASGTMTLPDPAVVGDNWFIGFRNSGSGSVTLDPVGAVMIDGASTKTYNPGESSLVVSDGANYYTIGYGKSAIFAFDYTSIAVAGTGIYALTGTELNRIAYDFTGILTGNRQIVVPTTVQQYWVTNNTTGAFTLTVKTAAGSGVTIDQGQSAILYCNGTNVVAADTAGLSTPISIANGGTGATTASGARVNLGGTSTGIAVFTSSDQMAARAALGAGSIGELLFTAATQANAWTALGQIPVANLGTVSGGEF